MWPLAGWTQQRAIQTIGILAGATERGGERLDAAFRQGLGGQGYFEGRNVEILYRWAETEYDRLPSLAADLVRRRIAAIIATTGSVPA